jgi:SAM-dependent methyltransferase
MAAVARRHLADHPWRVDLSPFEEWKPRPDDPPLDLVVSAQAWHWFRPEIRFRTAQAIIRPGGWLALWWNGAADFDNPARRAIDAAYEELAPEIAQRGVAGHGRPHLEQSAADLAFGPPIERDYPWSQTYSATEWCDLLRTQSDHRMLPRDRLEALLEAVERAIVGHGGVYTHPYVCRLWAAERM